MRLLTVCVAYTWLRAQEQFGPEQAAEIADLITDYTRYTGRRKPELLDAKTYGLINYRKFETVVTDYNALAMHAQRIKEQLSAAYHEAFYIVGL